MNYDRIKQQAGHLPAFQIADAINSTSEPPHKAKF